MLALRRRRAAIFLAVVAAVYAADLCAYGLKLAIGRPRPDLRPLVGLPPDGSFPSGHTATSFAGAAVLACFAPRLAPLLYLLAAAIGFSRIYVGVHWPLDVLGGAVLGTAVALLVLTSPRLLARSRRRSRAAPPPG